MADEMKGNRGRKGREGKRVMKRMEYVNQRFAFFGAQMLEIASQNKSNC